MLPNAAELSREILANLIAGSWSDVTARFDDQMKEGLDAETLAGVWGQVVQHGGELESADEPDVLQVDDVTVTDTLLHFENEDFVARLAFRADESLGGLYFLSPDAAAQLRAQQ